MFLFPVTAVVLLLLIQSPSVVLANEDAGYPCNRPLPSLPKSVTVTTTAARFASGDVADLVLFHGRRGNRNWCWRRDPQILERV